MRTILCRAHVHLVFAACFAGENWTETELQKAKKSKINYAGSNYA